MIDGWEKAYGDSGHAPLPEDVRHAAHEKGRREKFVLVPFKDIALGSVASQLVKGLIPRVGLTVVWGPPKCGKSFLVFDLTMHVALGWEYRGRRVRAGAVVYCALEGAEGFRARAQAFKDRHALNGEDVPFHLIAAPISLAADQLPLISAIRAALAGVLPAAVVVDTLNRSLAGSESDDRDMGAYIRAADAIRDAFDCAIIVVHHCGLEGSRPRGHTSLTGAADAQLSVKRDTADNIVVAVEWMKDGPAGEEFLSRLESVEVGSDEDGEPITSCVVVPVEGERSRPKKSGPKLNKGARIALDALQEVLIESGQTPAASNHIPAGVRAVLVDQWREHAYRRGISTSEETRARRLAFQRASEALVAAKLIGIWEPHVWTV